MDLKLGVAVAAMTMVAGAPPQDRGSEPKPMVPLTRLVTNDDYPAAALRADEQGTVAVELSVSPEGRVTGCRITASSGSAALDSTTCRVLASRGRFEPARDSRGRAIASTYQTHLRWALPPARVVTEPVPATPRSMMSVMRIELKPDGAVASCNIQIGILPAGQPIADRACPSEPPPQQLAELLRARAPAYRTLRLLGVTARAGQEVPESLRSSWGERLGAQISDLQFDEKGLAVKCTTVLNQPPTAGMRSQCETVDAQRSQQSGVTPGAPIASVRVENSVYGIRR